MVGKGYILRVVTMLLYIVKLNLTHPQSQGCSKRSSFQFQNNRTICYLPSNQSLSVVKNPIFQHSLPLFRATANECKVTSVTSMNGSINLKTVISGIILRLFLSRLYHRSYRSQMLNTCHSSSNFRRRRTST